MTGGTGVKCDVEDLKKARTQLRRAFTTACNQFAKFEESEEIESKEIFTIYNKIVDKSTRLFELDSQISRLTDISEEEFDLTESYRDKFIEVKVFYDSYVQKELVAKSCDSQAQVGANLKLPKIVLKEYEVIPRTWVAFWGQFSRIHSDDSLKEEDKFQYLLASVKPNTKARDIVESYPPSKENYLKVIEHLKSRFGRTDLLIEVYIRDLLALVLNRQNVRLAELYDKLGSNLRSLETLGVTTKNYAAMLYPVVESCLPVEVLKAWDRYRLNAKVGEEDINVTKENLLEALLAFLSHEVEGEEHRILAENGFGRQKYKREINKPFQQDEPTAAALMSSLPNKSLGRLDCLFCHKPHNSQDCRKASAMSLEERKKAVMNAKSCLLCFKRGHFFRDCRSKIKCLLCSQRHYVIMCPNLGTEFVRTPSKEQEHEKEKTTALLSSQSTQREIYLKTLMLRLRNNGKEVCVRSLLDDGSHRSYIETSLVKELNLQSLGTEILSQGLFGGGTTPAAKHGKYEVNIEGLDGKGSIPVSLLDQPTICAALPRIQDDDLICELSSRGIVLTDVGGNAPPIRILLGADILGSILTGRVEIFKSGISAVETILGWTIMGLGRKKEVFNMVSMALKNLELHNIWDLEVLGITDPTKEKDKKLLEEDTLIHFQETLRVNDEQRYEVTLPWLAGHPPLYNNRELATARLHSVTKRITQENTFNAYNEVFLNWKREGIIEEVGFSEMKNSAYYLPHRPVIKLSSDTTKIRPVFDASFKTKGSASLNDCLSTGPSLTQQIPPLINRFRWEARGVSADIKQAFLQISVNPVDRDMLRFLWWKDLPECPTIVEYRHCRVVFGISSSPFLLNATIQHHLRQEKFKGEDLAFTKSKLEEGFYVDNLITSVKDENQLQILKRQATEIMAAGCFDLRGWFSTGSSEGSTQSVLGLRWNCETDELSCIFPKTSVDLGLSPTKRMLLSIVNSVYDPIGFSCPAMLVPKLILQEAWKRKVNWDEELPDDLKRRFLGWTKHLSLIEQCAIPRRIFRGKLDDATLHIFSDASVFAYACCAFLRCKDQGEVFVNLVAAKSRVMPMNRPTIPRAELLGAAIAARLYKSIQESLKLPLKAFFWTDSMVVLAWIKKQEPWNTFVGRRVKEIREITDINAWRHVPGELNPTDLPSRSCNWSDLLKQKWWEGPLWLREDEELWPNTSLSCPEEALKERRKIVTSATNVHKEVVSQKFLYFSKYSMIVRMVAWIFRFYDNSRRAQKKVGGPVTSDEFQRAELCLIKVIQSEWSEENRKKYKASMKFYEDKGVLRVRTRLIFSEDDEDFQCPIVLPDHQITRRLIEYTHKVMNHAGVQTTLGHLRERFWIPRGRRIIREVISKCVPCRRHSVKHATTEYSPLPADRIQRVAAFQVVGADLAGPVFLRGGTKAWIILFTCAVYRAVHLELVTSLSTDAFLQGLRRFIARRGRCSVIYTDQGTNFRGTARALQSLDWEAIQANCAAQQIKWNFNPPSAPWYGGWWERLIRVLKDLLKRNLGKASLNYEEMLTVLADCEGTINQRPLTYTSEDPEEPRPLTPAHFLREVASPLNCDTIDLDLIDRNHLRKRLCYLQRVRENFRRRFQREYLAALVNNPGNKQRYELKEGDIVIVGSDNAKRIEWPLARVEELISGKDGKRRVARLKLAHTTLIRPIQRLYPLEIRSEQLAPINSVTETRNSDVPGDNILDASEVPCTRSGRQVKIPQRLDL